MVPIPKHLKENAVSQKESDNTVSFSLRCSCGCEQFIIIENYLSKDEKVLCKPYYDALELLHLDLPGKTFGSTYSIDENGKGHHWKLLSEDGKQRREVIVPDRPFFVGISVIKARCPMCGRLIPVFDSRKNGYNGITSPNEEALCYEPHFKQKGKKQYKITITVENDPSLVEFQEATGNICSFDFYSDAYSWITIHGIDDSGKKIKLYDIETA